MLVRCQENMAVARALPRSRLRRDSVATGAGAATAGGEQLPQLLTRLTMNLLLISILLVIRTIQLYLHCLTSTLLALALPMKSSEFSQFLGYMQTNQ